MATPSECPAKAQLASFVSGLMPEAEALQIEAHLALCERCLERTRSVTVSDTLVEALQGGRRQPAIDSLCTRRPLTESGVSPAVAALDTAAFSHNPNATIIAVKAQHELLDELAHCWQPAQSSNELGRLGGYRILKLLGAGGMGGVFLGEDLHLQRPVALKVMRPHIAAQPEAAQRFLREARAAAAVKHEHVVTIYQVGEDHGVPFIAQELLSGETLEDRLARADSLTIVETVAIGRQVAAGLAAAHARGLMHRDIKPANIWLETTIENSPPRVKLLDFGLARTVQDELHLTQSGVAVGTPHYMAPEQVAGEGVDHRADLFSLGVMLYRMTTGTLPFAGKNLLEVLSALSTRTPAPASSLNPEVPAALSGLIERLLAKQASQRCDSAQRVTAELSEITWAEKQLGGPSTVAFFTKPRQESSAGTPVWRQPLVLIGGSLGGALILALAIWVIIRDPNGNEVARFKVNDDQRLEVVSADKGSPPTTKKGRWHNWPVDAPQPAIAPFDARQAKTHQQQWADYLKVPVEHTNSIGMKFTLIPPGEFTMGSSPKEITDSFQVIGSNRHWRECIESEAPRHKVRLSQAIYLGMHEVTQHQYELIMKKNPSPFSPMGLAKKSVAGMDTTRHPVEMVSWNDAADFCAGLSQREDLKPCYARAGETVTMLPGNGYSLPTEATWEFACRAGTTTKYWNGDGESDLTQVGWCDLNAGGRTYEVGQLKANPFGLYDVHGNVWEWVQDWWERTYYEQFQGKAPLDSKGPAETGTLRVVRGGGWSNAPATCRAGHRQATEPADADHFIGFRVALPVESVKAALTATRSTATRNGARPSGCWIAEAKHQYLTVRLVGW